MLNMGAMNEILLGLCIGILSGIVLSVYILFTNHSQLVLTINIEFKC